MNNRAFLLKSMCRRFWLSVKWTLAHTLTEGNPQLVNPSIQDPVITFSMPFNLLRAESCLNRYKFSFDLTLIITPLSNTLPFIVIGESSRLYQTLYRSLSLGNHRVFIKHSTVHCHWGIIAPLSNTLPFIVIGESSRLYQALTFIIISESSRLYQTLPFIVIRESSRLY
jgi:hypothetical protein